MTTAQPTNPYAGGINIAGQGNTVPVWDPSTGTYAANVGAGDLAPLYTASQFGAVQKGLGSNADLVNPTNLGAKTFQDLLNSRNAAPTPGAGIDLANPGGG